MFKFCSGWANGPFKPACKLEFNGFNEPYAIHSNCNSYINRVIKDWKHKSSSWLQSILLLCMPKGTGLNMRSSIQTVKKSWHKRTLLDCSFAVLRIKTERFFQLTFPISCLLLCSLRNVMLYCSTFCFLTCLLIKFTY